MQTRQFESVTGTRTVGQFDWVDLELRKIEPEHQRCISCYQPPFQVSLLSIKRSRRGGEEQE